MVDLTLFDQIAQTGFAISVTVFLLWKGYTQDQKYLEVLIELKTEITEMRRNQNIFNGRV